MILKILEKGKMFRLSIGSITIQIILNLLRQNKDKFWSTSVPISDKQWISSGQALVSKDKHIKTGINISKLKKENIFFIILKIYLNFIKIFRND